MNSTGHGYEELREIVVDIILGKFQVAYTADQFAHLEIGVAEVLDRRENPQQQQDRHRRPRLHPSDEELVRDIFWDLFRQGFITLGLNSSNSNWPFFRLSYFGKQTLASASPWRFHDASSYLSMVRKEMPDISAETVAYLDEAVAAFYAGCLLASCVMLGVAGEAEFLRLVETAANGSTHGPKFTAVLKEQFIRRKIGKFRDVLKPLLPSLAKPIPEDLETNFDMIQSVLRIARNEAGHPTAMTIQREQVYVYLQLFAPLGRTLYRLRSALSV